MGIGLSIWRNKKKDMKDKNIGPRFSDTEHNGLTVVYVKVKGKHLWYYKEEAEASEPIACSCKERSAYKSRRIFFCCKDDNSTGSSKLDNKI